MAAKRHERTRARRSALALLYTSEITDEGATKIAEEGRYLAEDLSLIHIFRIFPGVPELLADLRETGLPFGVVTSKRHEAAVRGLATFGLDRAFAMLIGSDDCAAHKPDPGPVLQGCRQLGLRPEECAYVGDSPFDLQAGRGAGCPTAAVLWGCLLYTSRCV